PISLAHKLTMRLAEVRKHGRLPYLRPDGKSQVTVEYDANRKPVRVDAVVISTQHAETVTNDELRGDVLKHVIQATIPANLLDAAGLADRCEVQLAYAIGVAEPVSIMVDTFGTAKVDPEIIPDLIRAHFKLTPKGIIESLNLRRPIYCKTAAYGHFGRNDPDF